MKFISYLGIGLLLTCGLVSACTSRPEPAEKVVPATVLKVDGSEFSRVVLTEKAAERLGIQTERVRNEVVRHTRTVTGEVIDPKELTNQVALQPGQVLVKVFVSEDELDDLDSQEGAEVASLEDDEDAEGLLAELFEDQEGVNDQDQEGEYLVFMTDNPDNQLEIGQRVLVDVPVLGSGAQKKVIPYAAVIYGLTGETWVYTNPEPLVFIRQLVVIDYIEDDKAVLVEGLEPGIAVVTVGVSELYGAETGVSK